MPLRVNIDPESVKRIGNRLSRISIREILEAARTPVFDRLNTAKNAIRGNVSGSILNRRTGALAASIDFEGPRVQGNALLARLGVLRGPARAYADIHLTGGTIRPINAQKLAIPLPAAQTAAGVSRYSSPLRDTLAAAFPDGTFVAKDVLFGKVGEDIIPLFVLKDQVVIPKRDYMSGPMKRLLTGLRRDVGRAAIDVINQQ